MSPLALSVLTVCGLDELAGQQSRAVTHVLSLVDPDLPEVDAFAGFGPHRRAILRFHDIIAPLDGMIMPAPTHMASILRFGAEVGTEGHVLVHCHMGVSRSTAAMLALLAQAEPDTGEDALFARLRDIRPQAWPNSVMVAQADAQLGRGGRLGAALRRHYALQLARDPRFRQWMTSLGRQREIEMAA